MRGQELFDYGWAVVKVHWLSFDLSFASFPKHHEMFKTIRC